MFDNRVCIHCLKLDRIIKTRERERERGRERMRVRISVTTKEVINPYFRPGQKWTSSKHGLTS
jgi:hypothetical protein